MQVEVEGYAPHDDEARVQVLDLPAHRAASAGGGTALECRRGELQESGKVLQANFSSFPRLAPVSSGGRKSGI